MYILGIRIQKRFLSIPIVIIFLGVFYSLFLHEDKSNSEFKKQIKSTKAEFIINGFKLFESLQEGKDWNLKAEVAEVFQDKNITYLKKVFLTLYDTNGKIYKLTSDTAKLDMSTKNVTLTDNVVLRTDDNYIIRSNHVNYSPDTQVLSGPDNVSLEGPDLSLSGKGFKGSLDKRNLSIFNNVVTKVRNQQEGALLKSKKGQRKINLTVKSKKCFFDMIKNSATYTSNVHGSGNGFDIKSDKLIIDYLVKNKKRSVKSVLGIGRVEIKKAEKYSQSDRAFLDALKEHIILTGSPKLREGKSVIKGERIVYNYRTDKFFVTGAKGTYKTN